MNFTYFNRINGDFGQLSQAGIERLIGREGVPVYDMQRFTDTMEVLKMGQYFYVGNLVITKVDCGVQSLSEPLVKSAQWTAPAGHW